MSCFRKLAVVAALTAMTLACAQAAEPPAPYGPVPSARQLQWHTLEFYGFVHFTVNTFTDKEWGYGDEPESVFNPSDFDANQIVHTARDAGMKGLILTCKHHDGFCLWPSAFTEHSVKNSPWQNGRGDVVKDMADACRRYGLKFGIYLSPWDRNRADYGTPAYIVHYRNQLRELLTHYGPLFEVWFDGANGGDGYYGGAREKRTLPKNYYDWPNTYQLIRELQPNAVIFGGVGADIRWVGNENGLAGETCWDTLTSTEFTAGLPEKDRQRLNQGNHLGTLWQPPECDVSIRPGWFYHASQDAKVKTPRQLLDIYYASVGRGASLLLNLPPDRRGQIGRPDVAALRGFRKILDDPFRHNLARSARVTASNVRGDDQRFAALNVVGRAGDAYWSTDDGVTNANLTLEFKRRVTFNVVRLREYLPLGQRVEAFALDQWRDGQWSEFAAGTSIGGCRLLRCAPVTTDKVRLRITQSPVCPAISEVGLFAESDLAQLNADVLGK